MRGQGWMTLAIAAVTMVACGSPPATPTAGPTSSAGAATPATSPSTGSPAPSTPSATGQANVADPWTYTTGEIRGTGFGADGTAYVFSWRADAPGQLVALDLAGEVKPGWPQEIEDPGVGGGPIVTPDGDVVVLTLHYEGDVIQYALRRYGPDGSLRDGSPVHFEPGSECSGPLLDQRGRAIVACGSEAGSRVMAIAPDGTVDWDTALESFRSATSLQRGGDGTLDVASAMGDGLMALDAEGALLTGWPVKTSDGTDILAIPAGLLAWWHEGVDQDICHNAGQTVYTILGANGSPLAGWPQTVPGYGSPPAIGPDGTVVVVDLNDEAFALGPDGTLRSGWPVVIAGVTASCFGPPTASVASDGTVFVATGGKVPNGAISAIAPNGTMLDNWPLTPHVEFAYPCRECAPGPADPSPALIQGDVIYIAMYPGDTEAGTDIVGVDRAGGVLSGWPVHLTSGDASLQLAPDGRLFATFTSAADGTSTTLAYLAGGG